MTYCDELNKAMKLLSKHPAVYFVGQTVAYRGTAMYGTLEGISFERRIELPVCENLQTGMALGMFQSGLIPVSIYPRFDFLVEGFPQFINHIDKYREMSGVSPHLIFRTSVGSQNPLYPGVQHIGDYSEGLMSIFRNIEIMRLTESKQIVPAYQKALATHQPMLLVEFAELYSTP